MQKSGNSGFSRILRKALLTLLVVGVLGLSSYGWHSWQREEEDMREHLQVLSGFLASSSQAFFDDLGNDLAPLGELLRQIDATRNSYAAREHLMRFRSRHPQVRALAVFSPSGKMLINTAESDSRVLPDFRKDPPYLANLLHDMKSASRFTVGPPEFGKVIKLWRFSVRHVVRDERGRALFLVQAAIPLEKDETFLQRMPVPAESYIGLIRGDGFQQARYPVEEGNQIYGRISPGPAAKMIRENPGIMQGFFSGKSPWVFGEANRMGAFTRLPKLEMYAYISVPSSYLLHRWWQYNEPVFLSFVLFFILFLAIAWRVTKRELQHSHELLDQARRDALTGLPNRLALEVILQGNVESAEASGKKFSVMFLDLDRFKGINDTFGHAMGDRLLILVAQVLRPLLRAGDVLGRFGGDEFLIVMPGSDEAGVSLITQRILAAFAKPFVIDERALRITPSIGISIFPEHGRDIETLLKHADTAMYESKRMGRNAYTFYVEQMGRRVRDRLELEHQLGEALKQESFVLVYQPLVDMASKRIVSVEALVRWKLPNGMMRLPGEFIHLAEDSGMVVPLGEWVLKTACSQLSQWQKSGHGINVAVNLSTRQFQDESLLNKVREILSATGMQPQYLELEVTESAAMQNPEESLKILSALAETGVRIAIDDFGTGYSSLSYLKRIPADTIKIDKMFVDGLGNEVKDATIVRTVIALAHALGKKTVAEGIETAEQFEQIRAMGCDFGQGYLIGLPLTADRLTAMLEESAYITVQGVD